jgi:hypothetical protein
MEQILPPNVRHRHDLGDNQVQSRHEQGAEDYRRDERAGEEWGCAKGETNERRLDRPAHFQRRS